jgi:hypothetical protein
VPDINEDRVWFSDFNAAAARLNLYGIARDVPQDDEQEGDSMPTPSPGWTPVPEPWMWYGRARLGERVYTDSNNLTAERWRDTLTAIVAWADENNLLLSVYNRWSNSRTGQSIPQWFAVHANSPDILRTQFVIPEERFTCPGEGCNNTLRGFSLDPCPDCQCNPTGCSYCGSSQPSFMDPISRERYCSECGCLCAEEGCGRFSRDLGWCQEHGEYRDCAAGNHSVWVQRGSSFNTRGEREATTCPTCALVPFCGRCGRNDPLMASLLCSACTREELSGTGEEEFDEDSGRMTARRLRIPPIEGRENIRMCGIEIEGANASWGAADLAHSLGGTGLSNTNAVQSYHRGAGAGFAHIERDSSVDWELVAGPIAVNDPTQMAKLNKLIRWVRKHIQNEHVKLDLRCGLHIHVGAERASMIGAYNLHHLYTFLEDVLFRLGAAKWSVHRTLVQERGMHYCATVPKNDSKARFARAMEGNRYYGLSFSNYLEAMLTRCECGAVRYDSWDECECNLGKCTFEFRLFNTTANQRKIHAYLALCQALVAKALSMPEITSADETFPAMPFSRMRVKDMPEEGLIQVLDSWEVRLEWMASELPLTREERESILYCINNSEIALLGDERMNNAWNIDTEVVVG